MLQRILLRLLHPIILPKSKKSIPTPEHEYSLHGIFVVCGRRSSGKSVAVSSKLHHLKSEGLCDRVFLISPTAVSNTEMWSGLVEEDDIYEEMGNKSVLDIIEKIKDEKRAWDEYLEQLQLWQEYKKLVRSKASEEQDEEFLMKCCDLGFYDIDLKNPPESKYGHKPVLHLVVDDCQSSPLFQPSTKNKFLNLCIRHRHIADGLGVTIWALIQNYSTQSGLPKSIRENCTVLLVFPIKDKEMVKQIQSECAGEVDEETFYKMFDYATAEKHSFLSIDFEAKKPEYRFRKKFNEFISEVDGAIFKSDDKIKNNEEHLDSTEQNKALKPTPKK